MIHSEPPNYPEELKIQGVTGVVWVKAFVDTKGNVTDAEVAKSSGNDKFDTAALEVAPKNKFKPGIQNGKPVAVWVTYKVNFSID